MIWGWLIIAATFPGVIVHEAAHVIACRLLGVTVYKVRFLQIDRNLGYVLHAPAPNLFSTLLIATGPLVINSLICLALAMPASIPRDIFGATGWGTGLILWLAVSCGVHAFPSRADIAAIWEHASSAGRFRRIRQILIWPLTTTLSGLNLLTILWFDIIFGIVVAAFGPRWILKGIAHLIA